MPTDEDVGGSGGGSIHATTRDVRLRSRALAEPWDTPEVARQAIVDRLGGS
jgi:hypothetical protein